MHLKESFAYLFASVSGVLAGLSRFAPNNVQDLAAIAGIFAGVCAGVLSLVSVYYKIRNKGKE